MEIARVTETLRHRTRLLAAAAIRPTDVAADLARFDRRLGPGSLASETGAATARLYDRLSPADHERIAALIAADPELAGQMESAPTPLVRRHLTLAFAAHLGDKALFERTGLVDAVAPADVHALARGPMAAAGALYEADLVADTLQSVNRSFDDVGDALDFGCSSGRVVRVLAAAFPHVHWHGCDPNTDAITWATQALPGVEWLVSPQTPPLPYEAASLDVAFAISIWSHYSLALAIEWFAEMERVVRPGGLLVFTAHGWTSVRHVVRSGLRPSLQGDRITRSLYRDGYWFEADFGEGGDWGVRNPSWGHAFMTPEFVLTQLCPRWRVVEFAPGRNQENQDVYALEHA